MAVRYDVLSALGGELAKNVTLDTVFALLKGYELISPHMISHVELIAVGPEGMVKKANIVESIQKDMTEKAQSVLMSAYEATEE